MLAGPGTGKTTTLVESVVDRVERRGLTPDQILVLTFSRKAAADLRQRIAGRLGRSVVTPMVLTFHAFCYALVRRFSEFGTGGAPMRLLTAPEQEFRLREMLAGSRDTGRAGWPDSVAAAFGTRAFAGEVRAVLAKARQLGMDPDDVVAAGEAAERPEWQAIGEFFDEYLDVLDAEQVLDYAELVHRSRILLADAPIVAQLRTEIAAVFVDEYQDTDPAQVRLLQTIAGQGRDVVVVGDPDQSVYGFRGAEARGLLDFPELFPTATGAAAPIVALATTRRFGSALLAASRNIANRLSLPRALPPPVMASFRQPVAAPGLGRGRVEALTCTTCGGRGRADRRTAPRGAPARRAGLVRDGRAGAVRETDDPRAEPGAHRRRDPGRGGRRRDPPRRGTRGPPAAARPADRPPRLPTGSRRGPGAADLVPGRLGQHGAAASRPRPAPGRPDRTGRGRSAAALR